jgi:hypothetical protein
MRGEFNFDQLIDYYSGVEHPRYRYFTLCLNFPVIDGFWFLGYFDHHESGIVVLPLTR